MAVAPAPADYRAIVAQFETAPNDAIARMLALPAGEVAGGVRDAARPDSGWTAEEIDRALLMHGDAAVAMAASHEAGVGGQIKLADDLAVAAGARAGNEWFAHRWYKAFTARVPARTVETHWHQQGWFHTAAVVDRARQLELDGQLEPSRPDATLIDPPQFRQAIPLFEQGVAAKFIVANVHLGRIQMLRGREDEARRLLGDAARDPLSRVNRYLAQLLLGSLAELAGNFDEAEIHYGEARTALPHAQSGRLAMAALLARGGRGADAAQAVSPGGIASYDPWWSYLRNEARDSAIIFAELHAEVCR